MQKQIELLLNIVLGQNSNLPIQLQDLNNATNEIKGIKKEEQNTPQYGYFDN